MIRSPKTIITCNGRGHNLTIIDAATGKVTDSIALDGKPETAVSDNAGKIFVNIEDKNKISVVDISKKAVITSYPLGAEGPTGLEIDRKTKKTLRRLRQATRRYGRDLRRYRQQTPHR